MHAEEQSPFELHIAFTLAPPSLYSLLQALSCHLPLSSGLSSALSALFLSVSVVISLYLHCMSLCVFLPLSVSLLGLVSIRQTINSSVLCPLSSIPLPSPSPAHGLLQMKPTLTAVLGPGRRWCAGGKGHPRSSDPQPCQPGLPTAVATPWRHTQLLAQPACRTQHVKQPKAHSRAVARTVQEV